MLYFIVFCQLYSVFSKDLEKKYENTIGLQQFSIKTLIKNPFPELQKIVITLTYLQNDYPILIMCPNKPSNTALNSYEMLLKEKCYADLNAFDQQNEIQLLSIQSQSTYKEFQKNYNIYVLSSQDLFIGAYSQQASTFKISAQIIKSYNCAKICQNQGNCIDGICQCLIGYFGDDCGIVGLNLLDQIVLSPLQFYYLDLSQVPGTTFLKILSRSTPMSQQCYVDYPFINHGIQFVSNLIQLDQTRLDNCRNATYTFQLQMQINIMPYYIFKIYNDHEIQILIPDDSENTGSQEILLIIFTPLSFILLLLIFCCCYKFHKQNLMKEAAKNEKSQEKIPTYVDYYMPTQRFIKIKETEEQLYQEGLFCSICLEKFDALSLVKITYCKHIFHATCISQWLNKLKGCPLCRANLDEKNVAAMTPQKSMSLFDQITNKSSVDKNNNLFKAPTLNSLTSINNNGQRNQQNIQRSLAFIEQ